MGRRPKEVPAYNPADMSTWFTRQDVADALHCSVMTVRRLEGTRLHPQTDDSGVHRFRPPDIHRLAHAKIRTRGQHQKLAGVPITDGEVQSKVFAMLEEGRSRREIVIALEITAEAVQAIWKQWRYESFEDAEAAEHLEAARAKAQAEAEIEEASREEARAQRAARAKAALQSFKSTAPTLASALPGPAHPPTPKRRKVTGTP
jgi:hypothetical protein